MERSKGWRGVAGSMSCGVCCGLTDRIVRLTPCLSEMSPLRTTLYAGPWSSVLRGTLTRVPPPQEGECRRAEQFMAIGLSVFHNLMLAFDSWSPIYSQMYPVDIGYSGLSVDQHCPGVRGVCMCCGGSRVRSGRRNGVSLIRSMFQIIVRFAGLSLSRSVIV